MGSTESPGLKPRSIPEVHSHYRSLYREGTRTNLKAWCRSTLGHREASRASGGHSAMASFLTPNSGSPLMILRRNSKGMEAVAGLVPPVNLTANDTQVKKPPGTEALLILGVWGWRLSYPSPCESHFSYSFKSWSSTGHPGSHGSWWRGYKGQYVDE